ncbi:MAG: ATP-binding protein [Bacteroidia bacterium]
MREKIYLSWSGGKDSALAHWMLGQRSDVEVAGWLCTVAASENRVSMHGVQPALIEAQAKAAGVPLKLVTVNSNSAAGWEEAMLAALGELKAEGINTIAHGDIFLEDLRSYRDELLGKAGMRGLYPLWKKDTAELMQTFLQNGFETRLCCVSDEWFTGHDAGRLLDADFVKMLPAGVDPCGENGEFHTYCFSGPIYSKPISIVVGEKVYRSLPLQTANGQKGPRGFWYAELKIS